MNKNLNRRNILKLAAAAGGLFAVEKIASASPVKQTSGLAGNWLYQGQPCAIWQQGPVLILVNEGGGLATGQMTNPSTILIVGGFGWDIGGTGVISNGGNVINWWNNTQWQRA